MSRVPFHIGGPADTWRRQVKKKRAENKKNMEYQERRNGRIHEKEVDKKETFPLQK